MIQLGVAPNRVDTVTSIEGAGFQDAFPRRVTETWSGVKIAFVGLEDLKNNKRASGRLQDLADLDELSKD